MEFPKNTWVKFNTDGVSKGNSSLSSYAFCVRDGTGNLIYVEAIAIGVATNVVVEATTILKALQYEKQVRFSKIILESDSLSVIKFIKGEWRVPWELMKIIEEITTVVQEMEVHFSHTYKEGNQLANEFANSVINQTHKMQCMEFKKMPSTARRICNMDKAQVPALRIKTKKIQDIHN